MMMGAQLLLMNESEPLMVRGIRPWCQPHRYQMGVRAFVCRRRRHSSSIRWPKHAECHLKQYILK